MEQWWFVPSGLTFIPFAWRYDGTYSEETWPQDAIEATEEEVSIYRATVPPAGKRLGLNDGRPAWVDIEVVDDTEYLALVARNERDRQLSDIYDKGINIALRTRRLSTDSEAIAGIDIKIHELDIYAEDLLGIPEQAGFPRTIDWPEIPTK